MTAGTGKLCERALLAGSFNPTALGAEIEAAVIRRIYLEGGRASIPFDHGMGYDLVSDFDGVLQRIEVKRSNLTQTRPSKSQPQGTFSMRWEADLRARNMLTDTRLPDPVTSDFFVVLAAESFYVIPTYLIEGRSALVLRPPGYEPIKDTGRQPVLNTEDFRDAWALLKKEQS